MYVEPQLGDLEIADLGVGLQQIGGCANRVRAIFCFMDDLWIYRTRRQYDKF
jgi:hypothetical protein